MVGRVTKSRLDPRSFAARLLLRPHPLGSRQDEKPTKRPSDAASGLLILATLSFLLVRGVGVRAQVPLTEHTLKKVDGETAPIASLADFAWLAGNWKGEGLGGVVEEVWAPSLGGSMMGMFRLLREDKVVFYELLVIKEEEGRLVLRVKHFDARFVAWEDKEESLSFPLIRLEQGSVFFSGLTMEHLDSQTLKIFLAMRRGEGPFVERVLEFRRY